MTAFTLAHLSDPHVPPMPEPHWRELLGQRVLGYLNWRRNRHLIHRRDMLDVIVSDMQAQQPDHIAVTGDLVNLALDAEFPRARRWIESVGTPDNVSLVPGNHDAYVRGAPERFAETFGDYMRSDGTPDTRFPFLRIRGPLALIGVSSSVPTAPFMATGSLGDAQLRALNIMLGGLADAHLFRVLLIHHPLRSKQKMKRLTDSDALQAVLKRHGVELILHGHDHIHSTMWFDGPQRRIPAIGVPSASSVAHGHKPAAAYNLFAIERDGERWRCEQTVRGFGGSNMVHELTRTMLV
ncbi:metallophosphoesterase [Tardiphaga sp. OK245]|uniref:metallophosphoesterase family protein n=1 Tax=Tardiphaga sp. OK245 TaxID=1855306 RepID=UPI0008A79989|nr:metallophosphoesterase [Tardiphaga sp. OK245]SEI16939.1 3',5'-cyclic AMP phosphodiesterase CpdA [Tardiphaga sp. OK245]